MNHDDEETGSFDPDNPQAADPGPIDALPANERDYMIPAQDAKGHSARLWCRTIPAVARMIADVIASKKYPFRTVGDLIRWCVVDGVRRLAAGAGINSVTKHADAMIHFYQDEEFQLQFLEHLTHMNRIVEGYLAHGAPGEARRVVAYTQAHINAMPDGYWRQQYQQELLKRYSMLLDAHDVPAGAFDLTAADSPTQHPLSAVAEHETGGS